MAHDLVRVDPPHLPAPSALRGDLVSAWLAGRKQTTHRAYAGDLAELARFLGQPDAQTAVAALLGSGQGPANAHVLSWRAAMTDRGLAPATISRRLAAVRSVVRLARTLGMVAWGLDVDSPAAESYRETRGPGEIGYAAMLDAVAQLGDNPTTRRDLAILRLLHDRGLRRGEVLALELDDFDPREPAVAVIGKGKSQRAWLTIGDATADTVSRWIDARGRHPGALFQPLTNNRRNLTGRLTGESVRGIVVEHLLS